MTYNWNNMVPITVPTGTNGWLYSGEVIINGVKVRFPVGVPTSVPEPAAVLLKKMIELEQEEDANTAKPQNHYVGDVTIPAGKTLTLEKGAKFVDNSGGGEVVILPETELTVDGDGGGGEAMILTPLSAFPEVGGTCEVTYNGTAYDCPVISAPMNGAAAVALGNTEALELGAGNNDAPFAVVLFPNAAELGEVVAYGACVPMDGATTITLSIVQTEGGASGAVAGSTYRIPVTAANTPEEQPAWKAYSNVTLDQIRTAYNAGSLPYVAVGVGTDAIIFRLSVIEADSIWFVGRIGGRNMFIQWLADGSISMGDD